MRMWARSQATKEQKLVHFVRCYVSHLRTEHHSQGSGPADAKEFDKFSSVHCDFRF